MDKTSPTENVKFGAQKQENRITAERTLELIGMIETYPILWQKDHKDYKNVVLQEDAWRQIADIFGMPLQAIKNKWQNLRGQFSRLQARVNQSAQSGSASNAIFVPKWYAYSFMSCLLDSAEVGQTIDTPRRKRHPSPAESIEESSTKITISPVQEPKSSLRQPISPVVQHTSASLSRLSHEAQTNSSAHFKTEMLSVMQLFKEEYAEIRKRSRNSGFFNYANEELEKRDPALHDDIKKAIIDIIKTYPDNE